MAPTWDRLEAVLHRLVPGEKVVNLLADAPRNNPKASAYLLAAFSQAIAAEPGTIFFSVVDPGVGNFDDPPVALEADKQWYVGPDNGLFDIVCRRSSSVPMSAHRLATRNPVSQLSRPGLVCAGSGHAQEQSRHRPDNSLERSAWLARRPGGDRLHRPLRKLHDRTQDRNT